MHQKEQSPPIADTTGWNKCEFTPEPTRRNKHLLQTTKARTVEQLIEEKPGMVRELINRFRAEEKRKAKTRAKNKQAGKARKQNRR